MSNIFVRLHNLYKGLESMILVGQNGECTGMLSRLADIMWGSYGELGSLV